jgi:ribosomal protein L7/L12
MRWYWLIALGVLLVVVLVSRRAERANSPLARLREGGPLPTEGEIDASLRAGRKIEAIKLYRVLHGVDLKAAKEAIEARARAMVKGR